VSEVEIEIATGEAIGVGANGCRMSSGAWCSALLIRKADAEAGARRWSYEFRGVVFGAANTIPVARAEGIE